MPTLLAPLFPGMEIMVLIEAFFPCFAIGFALLFGFVLWLAMSRIRILQARANIVAPLIGVTTAIGLVGVYATLNWPIKEVDTHQIEAGMAEKEVVAILGKPHSKMTYADGTQHWYYYCDWGHLIICGIDFDPDDRVEACRTWAD